MLFLLLGRRLPIGEYWLAYDFRLSFQASAKLNASSLSLCFFSTGRRYLYGIRSPGLYMVCVVCGERGSPIELDDPDDVPDVLEEPLLNFLRISRARSRKTMIASSYEDKSVLADGEHTRETGGREDCYIPMSIRGRAVPGQQGGMKLYSNATSANLTI